MLDLYVKLGEGDEERFEQLQTQPSNQALKIMIDHDFISKALPKATPGEIFTILNLVWSVTSVQQAVANSRKAESP